MRAPAGIFPAEVYVMVRDDPVYRSRRAAADAAYAAGIAAGERFAAEQDPSSFEALQEAQAAFYAAQASVTALYTAAFAAYYRRMGR